MTMRIRAVVLATILLLVMTAGCGGKDTGGSPEYDLATLDSGNYPTRPRDISAMNFDKSGRLQEAARMGAVLPVAADIDTRLAHLTTDYIDHRVTPTYLPTSMNRSPSTPEEFASIAPGFVAGWYSRGERRKRGSAGRSLEMQTFRFETTEQAQAALPRFAQVLDQEASGEQRPVPGYPQARTTWSPSAKRLETLLVHDLFLLRIRLAEPVNDPPELSTLLELTQTALVKMTDALDDFSPTPTDQLASLPADVDSMLERTLPLDDSIVLPNGADPSMVLTAQGWLHSATYPLLNKAAYADAGVDLVSVSGSTLYRTRDTPSAERLVAALIAQEPDRYGAMDSPPNMPGVRCVERKGPNISATAYSAHCYLVYDRYAAHISGPNAQQVHQMTAAQYKILAWGS